MSVFDVTASMQVHPYFYVGAKVNVDIVKLTVWLLGYIPVRLGPHVQNSPAA